MKVIFSHTSKYVHVFRPYHCGCGFCEGDDDLQGQMAPRIRLILIREDFDAGQDKLKTNQNVDSSEDLS